LALLWLHGLNPNGAVK